jgi:uncharacterized protein YaaR (DUF327 family)
MNTALFSTAICAGIGALLWMASSFVGADPLALVITGLIACAYGLGVAELLQFRKSTGSLVNALDTLDSHAPTDADSLTSWLKRLDSSLCNPVRLRISGERVGLPAPAFTPYLLGLLIMLGLLGTFVGMVETLGGAVTALEGSTELEAMRQGLAAPIRGLGLAFGTSVAGVATSAMLGLAASLCRRERMLATRKLDTASSEHLQQFSSSYQRQQAYDNLETQARALPLLGQRLEQLAENLEAMGNTLSDTLLAQQRKFYDHTGKEFTELATSVNKSLENKLGESGRLAGESIRPVVEEAMNGIRENFEISSRQLTRDFESSSKKWIEEQQHTDRQRLEAWTASLQNSQESTVSQLTRAGEEMARLIEVTGETPRAAAEVIAELRREISANIERDNSLLEERQKLVADLGELFSSQEQAMKAQHQGIDTLVGSTAETLQDIGRRFDQQVDTGISGLSGIAAEFSGGSAEISALGETFSKAIERFSDSNQALIGSLGQIEPSLEQSTTRSDEQLGYYVAQAREVIDHSLQSQREIIEQMRELGRQQDFFPAEAS